jgi:DNA-binding NarL/FixJ family response regulator
MLTAFDRNHYYYSAAAAGVTGFLTKPVDFDTLETTIKKCMKENAFTHAVDLELTSAKKDSSNSGSRP